MGIFTSIEEYDITSPFGDGPPPRTGGGTIIWIWFLVIMLASIGLRVAVFYRRKNKMKKNDMKDEKENV